MLCGTYFYVFFIFFRNIQKICVNFYRLNHTIIIDGVSAKQE